MPTSERVRSSDVRAMFQLIGEAVELSRDPKARKLHVIVGLSRLVGANVAVCTPVIERDTGPEPYCPVDAGWSDPSERSALFDAAVQDAWSQDPFAWPFVPLVIRLGAGQVLVRRRQELVSDGEWYRSRHVDFYRRAARIDHCIYCVYRHKNPSHLVGISLHRAWGRAKPFGSRERQIAELTWSGLAWMHEADEPARQATLELSPRLAEVRERLLAGDSAKQVAGRLGLSIHTVREYIKALYRHYNVSSRAELLALFLRR